MTKNPPGPSEAPPPNKIAPKSTTVPGGPEPPQMQPANAALRALLMVVIWLCLASAAHARMLDFWPLRDADWLTYHERAPVSFTNLLSVSEGWAGNALLLDSTNAAWLQYNVFE